MKIAIGSDHAGFELKETLKKYLSDKNIEVKDFGTYSEERADYPDYAHAVSKAIEAKDYELGILICGSGNGISIAANKHKGIRAALCWNSELAALARQHNEANILSLPARFIDGATAKACVDAFLSNEFEGGRHAERVRKISEGC
ncbi:ribose 5-phosphate isomerase B [sediment metagenome]|uniref:Ribose 5-phosphate isomerase B n=1 Tax=sediment metagenome TaxID=749907 RepID=D9PHT9_9ZZZZ